MILTEQISRMKNIMGIYEEEITLDPNLMNFFHGGDLEDIKYDIQQNVSRQKYGSGLYLITNYDVAKKYAKGSRKFYIVSVEKGVDIADVDLDFNDVTHNLLSRMRGVKAKVSGGVRSYSVNIDPKHIKNGKIPAFIMNNYMINNNLLTPQNSQVWRDYLVNQGIDYEIVDNAFGYHETMMVLYNPNKIKQVKRIMPNDKLPTYDLTKLP